MRKNRAEENQGRESSRSAMGWTMNLIENQVGAPSHAITPETFVEASDEKTHQRKRIEETGILEANPCDQSQAQEEKRDDGTRKKSGENGQE